MVVSSNISVSDLVESLTEAFAVDDKWDNCVQEEFEIFTFSIVNLNLDLFDFDAVFASISSEELFAKLIKRPLYLH